MKSFWATFIDIWLLFTGHTGVKCSGGHSSPKIYHLHSLLSSVSEREERCGTVRSVITLSAKNPEFVVSSDHNKKDLKSDPKRPALLTQ